MFELKIDELKAFEGTEVTVTAVMTLAPMIAERMGKSTMTTEQTGELRRIDVYKRMVGRKTTENVIFMLTSGQTFTFDLSKLESFNIEPVPVSEDSVTEDSE